MKDDINTNLLANGSAAFKWKLHCYWLKGLWQHHVILVRHGPRDTRCCRYCCIIDHLGPVALNILHVYEPNYKLYLFQNVETLSAWNLERPLISQDVIANFFLITSQCFDPEQDIFLHKNQEWGLGYILDNKQMSKRLLFTNFYTVVFLWQWQFLTHWGRVMHICVIKI